MEVCARNLRSVQQPLAALNALEMNERRRFRQGVFVDKLEEEVICPKPRRPSNPGLRQQRSSTPRSGETGFEVLDIFLSKSSYGEPSSFGCSPPYFSGSPPTRAGNPLVRDVQFILQRAPAPTPTTTTTTTTSTTTTTPKTMTGRPRQTVRASSPCIRVEGFASAGTDTISALA